MNSRALAWEQDDYVLQVCCMDLRGPKGKWRKSGEFCRIRLQHERGAVGT
jgi:hypothetical protein